MNNHDIHYIVMCRVSGGVTGTREAPLKANGQIQKFDALELAEAEASKLNIQMNGPRARASFEYWAEAVS